VETEELQLQFFRHRPSDLLARPPLASSLQSFESSLFFLALGRYPHAFISCVFAIESALKARLAIPETGKESLLKLLERARGIIPRCSDFPQLKIDEMREVRNRIVHYGFGVGDAPLSAALLLEPAIPILATAYKSFDFDLYDSLIIDLGVHLRTALSVYSKVRLHSCVDGRECFSVLAHAIRWGIRQSFMTDYEAQAVEDAESYGTWFETVESQKRNLEKAFGTSWPFDCPICGRPESLVARLVKSQLDLGRITLAEAQCADCGLVIPDVPSLADTVCAEGVEESRGEILRGYGMSTP
jgi:hypothetical protein